MPTSLRYIDNKPSPQYVQFNHHLVIILLGTEPGIRTRDLPADAMLENQARNLFFEDTTEGQTESLSDEDTGGQAQGSTDEDQESTIQESTTQSLLDDSLEGPDGSDSDDGLLFALSSSDEGLKKGRDEALELDYEAFRTITNLLALTQTWPDLRHSNTGGPKPDSTSDERLILKICNSLAVLAVIQHEVIAIGVGYQLASVNVIISASPPEQLNLLVNKNPCRQESKRLNKLTEDQLTIEPQIPTGLKEFAKREENCTPNVLHHYITSLNMTRLVPLVPTHVLFLHGQNRANPTLEEHIWMLLKIFNTWKTPDDLNPRLMPYVTMASFPKMLRRINHPRSQFYLKVFNNVKLSNITFIRSKSKEPKATALEIQLDMEFLDLFSKTLGRWPQNEFPNLHDLATSKNEQSFKLYNKATFCEFHVVVGSIIKGFQRELEKLNFYREELRDNKPILGDIPLIVKSVNWYGHLLRRLCGGAALRTHLRNINHLLTHLLLPAPRRRRSFKAGSDGGFDAVVSDADTDADADVDADGEDLEIDEGSFKVNEESEESAAEHQVPWLICLKWLKLLIAQFDAANTLVGHIAVPAFPTISARILRNPPGARSFMPWKDLLKNPKYFPRESVLPGRDRDNANIISSLERAISGKPYELGSLLEDIQVYWQEKIKAPKTKDEKEEIASYLNKQFCKVEKFLVPGCQATLGDIKRNFAQWLENSSAHNPNPSLQVSMVLAGQINDQIDSMLDMCYIFSQFENPARFSGTVHCEANLANYLSLPDPRDLSLPDPRGLSLPDPRDPRDEKSEQVQVGYLVLSYNSYSHWC